MWNVYLAIFNISGVNIKIEKSKHNAFFYKGNTELIKSSLNKSEHERDVFHSYEIFMSSECEKKKKLDQCISFSFMYFKNKTAQGKKGQDEWSSARPDPPKPKPFENRTEFCTSQVPRSECRKCRREITFSVTQLRRCARNVSRPAECLFIIFVLFLLIRAATVFDIYRWCWLIAVIQLLAPQP